MVLMLVLVFTEGKEKPPSVDEGFVLLPLFFLGSSASFGKVLGPRHERIKVCQIGVRQFAKQILDVVKGFQTVFLCGLHYAECDGTGLRTGRGIVKQKVFSADHERFNATFCCVVVDGQSSIQKEGVQRLLLV